MIFVDHRTELLKPVRYLLSFPAIPIQYISGAPGRVADWTSEGVKTRDDLQRENASLTNQVLLLERRIQTLASTVAENKRLKELMNSAEFVANGTYSLIVL